MVIACSLLHYQPRKHRSGMWGSCRKGQKVVEEVGWPDGNGRSAWEGFFSSSSLTTSGPAVSVLEGSPEVVWINTAFSTLFSVGLSSHQARFLIRWLSISSQSFNSSPLTTGANEKAQGAKLYPFAMAELVPALSTDNAHYSSAHVFLMAHFTVLYIKLLWHLLFTANTVQVKIGFI